MTTCRLVWRSFAVPVCMLLSMNVGAENFNGPNSVPGQLSENAADAKKSRGTSYGERWDASKADLKKDYGFSFGLDYTSIYLNASETVPGGDDTAAAGMVRSYGSWDLIGRESANTGTFIWKVEHRHDYGSPAPSPLWSATELGYLGLIAPPFSDQGFRTTNFYWRQQLNDGKTSIVAGFLDVTDIVDLYGLVSPWMHFTNFVFSTGSAAMDLPDDAALGVGGATMLTENIYVIGTFVDANSDPEDPWEGFDSFADDNEYFTSAELGWTTGQEAVYLDNYHVTLWHKDARDDLDRPSGWGVNVSFARFVDETWMPFLRAGWSDDGDSLLERSVSTGMGYRLRGNRDLIGAGLNWGKPNPNQGAGDEDQYAAELFYRLLVGARLQLTADIQYLKDPAANPVEDSIWVFGARGKIAF
jgi:porin